MTQKYCPYGHHFVDLERLTLLRNPPRYICASCKQRRNMSRARIDQLTQEEQAERRAQRVEASKAAAEKKKRG